MEAFLEGQKQTSRENGRTPFQWDAQQNAGFTTGTPWLKVNPNYTDVNAELQEKDPNSTLTYFRKLVQLRKNEPTLIYGKFELVDENNPAIFAYTRELNSKKLLILLNFTSKNASAKTGINVSKAKVVMNNYATSSKTEELRPYEAVIYQL